MLRTVWVAVALVATTVAPAFAEPSKSTAPSKREVYGDKHVMVVSPADHFTAHADISPIVYLNRCIGDCTVQNNGVNDARSNYSDIPMPGPGCPSYPNCTLSEFTNYAGKKGSNGTCIGGANDGMDCTDATAGTDCPSGECRSADDDWADVVQCIKEVYSPYNIQFTETRPTDTSYTMALIAGYGMQINWSDALGVAPVAPDCSAQDNVISFSFANDHVQKNPEQRVWNMCWTAAQETAHAFGLDHEFQFSDGTSACNDPMTYSMACGGQKFFRNKAASCGEYSVRACRCGGSQNSHLKIEKVFGDATSLIGPPTVTVTAPTMNATVANGQPVTVQAGSQRGVETVSLYLNGYKWAEVPGARYLANGQPDPSTYTLMFPTDVPDGVIDIAVHAADDIGGETVAPTITVTKGAPCTSADTCAKGQKCDAGKCFWDAPVGALGDTCDYAQYCTSGMCVETSDGGLCSQECIVGGTDACPANYECQAYGDSGACIPKSDGGGCCSVGKKPSSREVWLQFAFGALVLGLVVRRRARRR